MLEYDMANAYSLDDLIDFLDHAGARGLLPAATAQALAVATRSVFDVLTDQERKDLSKVDIDAVIKRFTNKRASEFSASTIKEYGRRVRRAIDLFRSWQQDSASFRPKTRATSAARARGRSGAVNETPVTDDIESTNFTHSLPSTYQTAFPIRPGTVITIANIPHDLTKSEAERLANFVRMLAV